MSERTRGAGSLQGSWMWGTEGRASGLAQSTWAGLKTPTSFSCHFPLLCMQMLPVQLSHLQGLGRRLAVGRCNAAPLKSVPCSNCRARKLVDRLGEEL